MKQTISFEIDTDKLKSCTDTYLAQLWHIVQANPAGIENKEAGEIAEHVGREIIRRFLANTSPELWAHQGRHHYWDTLAKHGSWENGVWKARSDNNKE